jgi:hypothetical protein
MSLLCFSNISTLYNPPAPALHLKMDPQNVPIQIYIWAAIRAMLYSAALESKFLECVFYCYLCVHTVLPHGQNKISHYQMMLGLPADVSNLLTF